MLFMLEVEALLVGTDGTNEFDRATVLNIGLFVIVAAVA